MFPTPEPSSGQNALNADLTRTPLATVQEIAAEHFGLPGKAVSVSSERDETFLVETTDRRRYVLKIANPAERADILEFQTNALLHLERKALPLPLPQAIASRDGDFLLKLRFGNQERLVRMLSFLNGLQLYKAPRSRGQMRALGRALALLGTGLSDFRPAIPQQELLWDICNAAGLRPLSSEVAEPHRSLVLTALDGFDTLAEKAMGRLPRQVIHNDFNPHNILVSESDPGEITGVIDFGDMVEAPLVNDLAVALSYQLGAEDGLDCAAAMLAAYQAVRPLGELELNCLPTLVRTRLAMTVIITEWRASLHPGNRAYILRNHPVALAGLKRLAEYGDTDLGALFRRKIGENI